MIRRTTYEEVAIHGTKSVTCAHCQKGRKIKRAKKFYQTLNPFNPNDTPEKITLALMAERQAWQAAPEICAGCREKMNEGIQA